MVITGDFNAGENNPAVTAITASGTFVDTFRMKYPNERVVGTFTGFDPAKVEGDKIDYVFVPPQSEVLRAEIVRTARGGPSAVRSLSGRRSDQAAYSARSAAMTSMRSAWRAGTMHARIAVAASSTATTA